MDVVLVDLVFFEDCFEMKLAVSPLIEPEKFGEFAVSHRGAFLADYLVVCFKKKKRHPAAHVFAVILEADWNLPELLALRVFDEEFFHELQ